MVVIISKNKSHRDNFSQIFSNIRGNNNNTRYYPRTITRLIVNKITINYNRNENFQYRATLFHLLNFKLILTKFILFETTSRYFNSIFNNGRANGFSRLSWSRRCSSGYKFAFTKKKRKREKRRKEKRKIPRRFSFT